MSVLKYKNRVLKIMATLMVLLLLFPVKALGATPEQWGSYDVRTKPNSELTAELLDDVFNQFGKGGVLIGMGSAIMEAGNKNGINPGILAGMIIHETGWGKSNLAINNNNLGGIKCKTGFKCNGTWTVFDSPVESIQVQAELLAGKTYVGGGRVTMKQILEVYAPPSDGNTLYGSGGYIAVVGSLMEKRFKQSVDGGTIMEGTGGTYTEGGSGTSVGSWASENFFMESQAKYNGSGVDTSEGILPSELSYGVKVFSEKVYKNLTYLGVALSLGLIVYMSFTVLFYVALVKGIAYRVDVYEKLTRSKEGEGIHSRSALLGLVGRMVVGVMLMSFFMTGLYIDAMALVYIAVGKGLDLVF